MINNLLNQSIQLTGINFHISANEESPKTSAEFAAAIRKNILENDSEASSPDDSKMMAKITAKMKSGKRLSQKEEQYLAQANPLLYQQYLRIRKMAEVVESRLKHAKSKEEVNSIICSAVSGISDKDPYKEYIVAAINETAKEFKSSEDYSRLPDTDEEAKKGKKHLSAEPALEESDSDSDSDSFDPMTWSPLQDIIDNMPTFESPA